MNLQPDFSTVVRTGRLCLFYWAAQTLLALVAFFAGATRPALFLAAAILGALPVLAYAHFLFWNGHRPALRAWALRCVIALFLLLALATWAWYAPQREISILWLAACVLLTFVLYACGKLAARANR